MRVCDAPYRKRPLHSNLRKKPVSWQSLSDDSSSLSWLDHTPECLSLHRPAFLLLRDRTAGSPTTAPRPVLKQQLLRLHGHSLWRILPLRLMLLKRFWRFERARALASLCLWAFPCGSSWWVHHRRPTLSSAWEVRHGYGCRLLHYLFHPRGHWSLHERLPFCRQSWIDRLSFYLYVLS